MKFGFYALKLCIVMILIFLIQILVSGFTELFVLNSESWAQIWRFVTSIFLHSGAAHLIYNLFALALFGSILEALIGGRRFLIVFFAGGILANLIAVNFYSNSLGASGAIFSVIGALIVVRPMLAVWAFGMPMPIFVAGILWGIGDFIGAYGFLTGNPIDNTGNIAHLSGMFFGMVIGAFFRGKVQRQRKIRREGFRIDEREIRNWEERYLR